jgi:hypothetical protein
MPPLSLRGPILVWVMPKSIPLTRSLSIEVDYVVYRSCADFTEISDVGNLRTYISCDALLPGRPSSLIIGRLMDQYEVEREDDWTYLRLITIPCLTASRPFWTTSGVIRFNRPSSSSSPYSPQALYGGPSFLSGRAENGGNGGSAIVSDLMSQCIRALSSQERRDGRTYGSTRSYLFSSGLSGPVMVQPTGGWRIQLKYGQLDRALLSERPDLIGLRTVIVWLQFSEIQAVGMKRARQTETDPLQILQFCHFDLPDPMTSQVSPELHQRVIC